LYLDNYGNYIGPGAAQPATSAINSSYTGPNQYPNDPSSLGYQPSTTGGARPGDELLRSSADSAANNLLAGSNTQGQLPSPAGTPSIDFGAILAAAGAGSGAGGTDPNAFLAALMQQLGPAPQMPQMDVNKMALDQIQLQYGQQEQAFKNAIQQLANTSQQNQQVQTQYGQTADTRLQAIYDALRNDLYRNQGQVADIYGQTQGSVRGSYDQASDALSQLNNQVIQQLGGTADQLGIQQGMGNPLARILSSYQTMQGGNLQNKATSLAGLSMDQANQLALGDRQIGAAANQGATARKDLAMNVQNALAQLGLQTQTQQGGLQSQIAALEAQKPADYRTAVNNLAQMQYNMQRQARQDQLGSMVQLGTLQQGQENINLKQQEAANSLGLGMGNLSLQQAKLQQDYNLATDPLKRAQLAAQIDLLGAQGQYYQDRGTYYANGGTQTADKSLHGDLLNNFLTSEQPGLWGPQGSGPQFRSSVLGLINDANTQAKALGVDPYAYALQQLLSAPGNLDQGGLMAALQRYYKGT
jgi:hypothetical protein